MAAPKRRRRFTKLAHLLAEMGRDFCRRGWALGTSGNFSAVASRDPFRLLITATGVDKSRLTLEQVVLVDAGGKLVEGARPPSVETALHLAIVRTRRADAVLHTHSIWSTILSDEFGAAGGISIEGYEMVKGLAQVQTHLHREWLPILENTQNLPVLASSVAEMLEQKPGLHGFLLRRHGLYTWGNDLAQAKRHLEILEFLLEVMGRKSRPMSSNSNDVSP